MSDKNPKKLIQGYEKFAHRVHELISETGTHTGDRLKSALLTAQDEMIALKELTKIEAREVNKWVKRDLHAISKSLANTRAEVKEWLPIELEAEEQYVFDRLKSIADQTTVELLELKEQAEFSEFDIWHTGEIAAAGVLKCIQCGNQLHFEKTAHIPPCSKCHQTTFARIADDIPSKKKT